jgi:hypothetical protein
MLAAIVLAGCQAAPPARPTPMPTLERSYATLKQVVDTKADVYASDDMQEARVRYNLAYQLKDTYPQLSVQLAEEAQAIGDYTLAKAHADMAARERAKAENEMAVVERVASPEVTSAPARHSQGAR